MVRKKKTIEQVQSEVDIYADVDSIPITFGKYRDRLVSDVIRTDPHYLKWAMESTDRLPVREATRKAILAACKATPQPPKPKPWLSSVLDWWDLEPPKTYWDPINLMTITIYTD